MKTSTEQRIANSIKWLDELRPGFLGFGGYRKTEGKLGKLSESDDRDWAAIQDHKADGKYCCLGVACLSLGILTRPDNDCFKGTSVFPHAYDSRLTDFLGFAEDNGYFTERILLPQDKIEKLLSSKNRVSIPNFVETIMELNDRVYGKDKNFKNVRRFILDNLDRIFLPEVSDGIKKHYGI